MYKKVSVGIITILATAAIMTVPSSVLQVSYAQTNQDMQTVLDVHNRERAARWSSAAHVEQQSRRRCPDLGPANRYDRQVRSRPREHRANVVTRSIYATVRTLQALIHHWAIRPRGGSVSMGRRKV